MKTIFKTSLLKGKWPATEIEKTISSLGSLRAAINVIYTTVSKRTYILLVKRRNSHWDPWSGDVGFPGGGVKRGESPLVAALRETFEETGIPPKHVVVLGSLGVERTQALPGLEVYAYLSKVPERLQLRISWSELSDAWWVPLSLIRGPYRLFHPGKGRVVEAYVFPDGIVWGMSKRILDRVLKVSLFKMPGR